MTWTDVLRIVRHPVIFRRKHIYATRIEWFRDASAKADELEASDTSKPFRVKVLMSYVVWSRELKAPVAHLVKDGVLKPVYEKDLPEDLLAAQDWYVVLGEPHVFRWANRDKMNPDWLKSLPDIPSIAKALLDEPLN